MERLLVRATNWLGDAVMSIPALREIRQAHPGWHVSILALPWVAALYDGEPFCDEVVLYHRDGRHRGVLGRERIARDLRGRSFDRAILLQNAFDAAWLAWRARIPQRIGYSTDGRGPLLTHRIVKPRAEEVPAHQRFYYLELLCRAGFIEGMPEDDSARLEGAERLRRMGRDQWRRRGLPEGPWIGVSPGAAFGSAKRWLPERFADAARVLALESGSAVAVFGSPAEASLAEDVARRVGGRSCSLAGRTTLAEYLQLASTCSLYLTNDSGAMHVAAALGIPTVAVFGATDFEATGPAAPWARIVREPVECAPCLLRECPLEGHPCMTGVGADRVVEAARELLAENDRSRGNGL